MTGDFCYSCDGTGERDWLSGARCYECNGSGWIDDELTDEERDSLDEFWEDFYREEEAFTRQPQARSAGSDSGGSAGIAAESAVGTDCDAAAGHGRLGLPDDDAVESGGGTGRDVD